MSVTTEGSRPFAAQLSDVYLTILALFCCKLFIRITLNLLTHFYIIKGNRREAARICQEFYSPEPGSWADRSPLHDAASHGRLLALKTLITQGHSVNALTVDHVSPLHEACIGSHVACARALIDAGANVNVTTIDGVSPLFNACSAGSVMCVELLLECGARPQVLSPSQPSAIHEAASRGHSQCVEVLVKWGAELDYETRNMGTPLYTSCRCREFVCARKLLDGGASVQRGSLMETPLHAAAQKDCLSIVKLLLEFGADVNARNLSFKRPVDVAPPGGVTEGFLLIYEATPRSLSHLCRQRIRACLGRPRLPLVPHLPIPKPMKNFLQYR
ncbi:ankyrin repeat and SOCS box protein 5 isoform X2 [Brachyhypopomus gauderio]|uniref:ankyrin repeat and SOCS box protein 5 isoform X2 n=1 Tax=Brachyhypopomus gauderio TaxID=698409 RepID=UPI004043168C